MTGPYAVRQTRMVYEPAAVPSATVGFQAFLRSTFSIGTQAPRCR
ncbi:hypothetical protein SGLAM104S_03623 [Streptomyces glaucescens]